MSDLPNLDKFGIVSDVFDGKVVLTCQKHGFAYNPKKMPTPGCKGCHFVQHLGLLVSVPPARREEILEDLEYSVHHMVEAVEHGTFDRVKLARHPEVFKDGQRIS